MLLNGAEGLTPTEEAEWLAIREEWRLALDGASDGTGRLTAASGMFLVALEALRKHVGDGMLSVFLSGLSEKVRAGEFALPDEAADIISH